MHVCAFMRLYGCVCVCVLAASEVAPFARLLLFKPWWYNRDSTGLLGDLIALGVRVSERKYP